MLNLVSGIYTHFEFNQFFLFQSLICCSSTKKALNDLQINALCHCLHFKQHPKFLSNYVISVAPVLIKANKCECTSCLSLSFFHLDV